MKLTPFGKLFLVLVIVGVGGFIAYKRFGDQWCRLPQFSPCLCNLCRITQDKLTLAIVATRGGFDHQWQTKGVHSRR